MPDFPEPQLGTIQNLASRLQLHKKPDGLAPVTFLIGAGCSVSAGIPAVNTIAKQTVTELSLRLTGATPQSAEEALINLARHGYFQGHTKVARTAPTTLDWGQVYDTIFSEIHVSPSEVANFFKTLIRGAKPRLNWAHLCLGELARQNYIRTLITTNFDLLALQAYAFAGVIPVVSDGVESLGRLDPNPDTPQLLQINGSLHSYRLRNSIADLDGLKGSAGAIGTFRSLFSASEVMVFVGYEGREPQIMQLLTDAAKEFPDKHIFWSLHSKNPADLSEKAREFLSYSQNARLIPGQDADLFFNQLLDDLGLTAPLVFIDPLQSLEIALGTVFGANGPDLTPVKRHIDTLRDRLASFRNCDDGNQHATPQAPEDPHPSNQIIGPDTDHQKEALRILQEIQATHPGDQTARFSALRAEQDRWYVEGRDLGQNFGLSVSICLAEALLAAAIDPDQRGVAFNDLGISLTALGEREGNTDRLEQAVTAHLAALNANSQDRVPLAWAATQNNLGAALTALGQREASTDLLEQAVTAYREALKEYTQDRVPLNWAGTQNNLGATLSILAEREGSTEQLKQAIIAYREALKEYTQDRVPLDWAMTQSNLGNALMELGKREGSTDQLKQAVIAYREALKERTQDRVPLDWAITQNSLGNALMALGQREGNPEQMEQAVSAYREALKEQTQVRVPLNWATTQNNLGNALTNLGRRERRTDRLEQAGTAYREALKERTQDRVPLDWAMTQANLAGLDLAFDNLAPEPARLRAAREKALAARQVFASAQAAGYLAMVDRILAQIDAAEQAAKG